MQVVAYITYLPTSLSTCPGATGSGGRARYPGAELSKHTCIVVIQIQ